MRVSPIQTCTTAAMAAVVVLALSLMAQFRAADRRAPKFTRTLCTRPNRSPRSWRCVIRNLSPKRKVRGGAKAKPVLKIYAERERDEPTQKKGGDRRYADQKQAGPMTVDDLFADIDNKL